jgi:hypothetical protein
MRLWGAFCIETITDIKLHNFLLTLYHISFILEEASCHYCKDIQTALWEGPLGEGLRQPVNSHVSVPS